MGSILETDLSAWLLKTTWEASVLVCVVLLAQWNFRQHLAPRWRYRLWLLVVIRLALPCSIESDWSMFNFFGGWPSFEAQSAIFGKPFTTAPSLVGDGPKSARKPDYTLVNSSGDKPHLTFIRRNLRISPIAWIWLAGALGLSLKLLRSSVRLNRIIGRQRILTNPTVLNLLEDCRELMGVRAPLVIVETDLVAGPALYGFLRPRLLLPEGFTACFTEEELRQVLTHELAHIKRHDIAMNWSMTALHVFHWFNPFVWLAFQRMRADRELACDQLALSYAREGESRRYGETIIKLLETFGRAPTLPCLAGILENTGMMRQRIGMIANFPGKSQWSFFALPIFLALGAVGLTDAKSVKFPSAPEPAPHDWAQSLPAETRQTAFMPAVDPPPVRGLTDISPEALQSPNAKMLGLVPDNRSLQTARAQALIAISQIKEARQELGEDAGDVLDGYLGVLEKFVQETQEFEGKSAER